MKLKKLFDKALVYTLSAFIIFLLLTLVAQVISLAAFVLVFISAASALAYLFFRKDKCSKP